MLFWEGDYHVEAFYIFFDKHDKNQVLQEYFQILTDTSCEPCNSRQHK